MLEKEIDTIATENVVDKSNAKIHCAHCGEKCTAESVIFEDKTFCCFGCKSVFEILAENDLCDYYLMNDDGVPLTPKLSQPNKFTYLETKEIAEKLIRFKNNQFSIVEFALPQIHCSSCVWLLEKLYRINKGIIESTVDINRKTISIKFDHNQTNLKEVAETLVKVGYEPDITLDKIESNELKRIRKNRLIKLGVAGFCFGNIMMLSLPEYFSIFENDTTLKVIPFKIICFLLSLPVFFYCSSEFYIPAIKGLKNGFLNIDAPVFLAVAVTFFRSVYEITFTNSSGYFDSMSGIVFFMLLGRVFQDITYKYVSFEKNISSFIPLAISKQNKNHIEYVPVTTLVQGDIIIVKNEEICPTDGILISENATVDYSFVTGESEIQNFKKSEKIYAGGKINGLSAEIMVLKNTKESYLHSIWTNNSTKKNEDELYKQSYIHAISKWFTLILIIIAVGAFTFWSFSNLKTAFDALTTVLIVACPCVLLLSHTYTYGFISNILTKNGIYLKNVFIVDRVQNISHVVFDKTGTLTTCHSKSVQWVGQELNSKELSFIKSAAFHSTHPKSKLIYNSINCNPPSANIQFKERQGYGITAEVENHQIKIGSENHLELPRISSKTNCSYVSIDGQYKGYFKFTSVLKNGLQEIINEFPNEIDFTVLSGDNDADQEILQSIFPYKTKFIFNALPHQKLDYVKKLQSKGKVVAMIGDGINDSGALSQANIGISIASENTNFVPACDVYIEGNKFNNLPKFFRLAKDAQNIVLTCFIFALIYNSIGLIYAITGTLNPAIAAILMPASTITIILITFGLSHFSSKRIKLN